MSKYKHSKKQISILFSALGVYASFGSLAYGATNAQTFTYQGRLLNSAGTAPLLDIVDLTFSIYDPAGTCLLYEEKQTGIDVTTTDGIFAVQVGSITSSTKRTANDPTLTMATVFSNNGTITNSKAPCSYASVDGAARKLRVVLTPHSTGVPTTLTPDQTINAVPQTQTAETLQGLTPNQFLQVNTGTSAPYAVVPSAALDFVLGTAGVKDASTYHNHDSLYVKIGSGGTSANLGSGAWTAGSFGIGTSTPTGNLGFAGNLGAQIIEVNRNTTAASAGNSLSMIAGGATSGATNQNGGNLVLSGGTSTGSGGSSIQFQTSSSGVSGTADNAPTTKMVLTSSGNLGVGTTAPTSQLEVVPSGTGVVGTIIQGAPSQTADLLEIQNSTGAVLSKFDSLGFLTLPGNPTAALQATTKQYVDTQIAALVTGVSSFNTRTGAITLTSADVTGALGYTPLKNSTDTMSGNLTVNGVLSAGGAAGANAQFQSTATAATQIGAIIKGFASQSADLLEVQDSTGAVLTKVDNLGMITLKGDPTTTLGAVTKQYVDTALAAKQGTGSYLTGLTGDVSATGPGTVAATVNSVGTSTAANIHTAELAANAATNLNTASTIVKRDASGNFTAGTVTANLVGNVTGASSLNVLKAGDTMTGTLNLPANGLVAGTNQLVLSGGNVGIGTTAPFVPLDVVSSIASTNTVTTTQYLERRTTGVAAAGMGAASSFVLQDAGGSFIATNAISSTWVDPLAANQFARMDFYSSKNNTQSIAMSIDPSGSVGIGTTTPSAALDVQGWGIANRRPSAVSAAGQAVGTYNFDTMNGTMQAEIVGVSEGTTDTTPNVGLAFRTGGSASNKFYISPAGNIGVGTSTPSAPLQVSTTNTATSGATEGMEITPTYNQVGSTAANTDLLINRTVTSVGSGAQNLIDAQVGGISQFKVDASGNVTAAGTFTNSGQVNSTTQFSSTSGLTNSTTATTGFNFPSSSSATITTSGSTAFSAGSAANTVLQSGGTTSSVAVRGLASQTADLFDVQNSAGTPVFKLDSTGNLTLANATAATSGANASSNTLNISGNYWNGSATAVDTWSMQDVLGTGTNPASTLTFTHAGSTGTSSYAFMNGNVGVGTSSPQVALDVRANANGLAVFHAGTGDLWTGNVPAYGVQFGSLTNDSTSYYFQARQTNGVGIFSIRGDSAAYFGGNVGIGITSPAAPLHIYTLASTIPRVEAGNNGVNSEWQFVGKTAGGVAQTWDAGMNVSTNDAAFEIYDRTAAAARIHIAPTTGNVGIGTTSPATTLEIKAPLATLQMTSTTATNKAYLGILNGSSGLVTGVEGSGGGGLLGASTPYAAIIGQQWATPLQFGTNNVVRMTLDGTGNVGIGTTAPGYKLEVATPAGSTDAAMTAGGTNSYSRIWYKTDSATAWNVGSRNDGTFAGGFSFENNGTGGGTWTSRLFITPLGNVGIGTTNPSASLEVDATPVNSTATNIRTSLSANHSANGTYYNVANASLATTVLPAAITDSGYVMGQLNQNLRNYASTGDKGTLASLYATQVQYGHYNSDAASAPVTTSAFGVSVIPYISSGTITNMYDVFLGNTMIGGTATNHWGIFQQNTAPNSFAGNVGIGTTSPSETLQLNATITPVVRSTITSTQVGINNIDVSAAGAIHTPLLVMNVSNASTNSLTQNYAGYAETNVSTVSTVTYNNIQGFHSVASNSGSGTITNMHGAYNESYNLSASATVTTQTGTNSIVQNNSTGTITNASGVQSSVINFSTGTITNAYGLNIPSWTNGGTIGTGYGVYLGTIAGTTNYGIYQSSSSNQNYFAGNVGIGTTAPTYQLQLSTDSAAKPGTSTWAIASDARLKDIRASFDRGLEALEGIHTIYFRYKKDNPLNLPSDKEYVGIIAQDAQKAVPESVHTDDKGFLHVSNDAIIWTVFNSVKELYHRWLNDSQAIHRDLASKEEKIQKLESENAAMKAYLCGKDSSAAFCH